MTHDRTNSGARLDQGAFVLSIDTELMWGSFHRMSDLDFEARHGTLRDVVTRLLALLDKYEVPATWAMVGHLFLAGCTRGPDGRAHPELSRARYTWYSGDWYDRDPCGDVTTDPLWYAPDILQLVRHARAGHEIGSHSFAHLVFGDPGCSPEAARDDLAAWAKSAQLHGLQGKSFVFPRNRIGHLELLAAAGFRCYRGYPFSGPSNTVHRAWTAAGAVLGSPAPVFQPALAPSGLLDIPGSMPLLVPKGRLRRFVPLRARISKARGGLRRAARQRALFHIWLHPMDLCQDQDRRFAALETILSEVRDFRDRGVLQVHTMASLAEVCEKAAAKV